MRLLNIRLDSEDLAKVQALRARGVNVSHLLRQAIRAEHQRRAQLSREGSVEEALAEIYSQHPVAAASKQQRFYPHHRRRFRKAVGRYVRRRAGR